MDKARLLTLIKNRLGITSEVVDIDLAFLIDSSINEISYINGLELVDNPSLDEYIVDLVCWKYKERDTDDKPKWLKAELRELMIKGGVYVDGVNNARNTR